MEKIVNCYCKDCKKITKHIKRKDVEGFERVFAAIFTVGFSELDNASIYMCTQCEKETTYSLL